MIDNNICYEIEIGSDFEKELNRFVKKKKFTKLPAQIKELMLELENGEFSGTLLLKNNEPVPYEVYKKRLPNKDTNTGKSGGYRVIYLVRHELRIIALLSIYYKKEQETLADTYIMGLIDGYFFE